MGVESVGFYPMGNLGIGQEIEVIAHSKPQESIVKHCGCIKFKGEWPGIKKPDHQGLYLDFIVCK